MTDFAIEPSDNGDDADFVVFNGDAVRDDSLRPAVAVSLFTDREATAEQLAAAKMDSTDRRGWWGDMFAQDGDKIGSLLWLLARAKQTDETAGLAKSYAEQALAWMVRDGVANSVTVAANWIGTGFLVLAISLTSPSGDLKLRYAVLWSNSVLDPLSVPNGIAADAARIAAEFDFIWYQQLPGVTQ